MLRREVRVNRMVHAQEVVVEENASQVDGGADGSPEIKDAVLTIASKLNKDVEAVTTHLGNVETLQHDLLQQLAQSIERWEQGIQQRLDEGRKQIGSLETKIEDLTQRLSKLETTSAPPGVEIHRLDAELHRVRLRVKKIILFILLATLIGLVIGIRR